jgi:hypothetical protein
MFCLIVQFNQIYGNGTGVLSAVKWMRNWEHYMQSRQETRFENNIFHRNKGSSSCFMHNLNTNRFYTKRFYQYLTKYEIKPVNMDRVSWYCSVSNFPTIQIDLHFTWRERSMRYGKPPKKCNWKMLGNISAVVINQLQTIRKWMWCSYNV